MRLFTSALAAVVIVLGGAPVGAAQSLHSTESPPIAVSSDPVSTAREQLAAELAASRNARRLPSLPPGWSAAMRAVERRVGVAWNGPPPLIMQIPDDGSGFVCEAEAAIRARCLGRTEGVRDGERSAFVLLFASSAMLDRRLWEHELTHALLQQSGRDRESRAHDPHFFR